MIEHGDATTRGAGGDEELVSRYLTSRLLPRLLMRFVAADRPVDLARDLAAPLELQTWKIRNGVRILARDGLVKPCAAGGSTFILARDSATLALVRDVLCGAIERNRRQ